MGCSKVRLRLVRLTQQDIERRDIGVPFDQCGPCAEALNRMTIQRPNGLADLSGVRVNECFCLIDTVDAVSGQMQFSDGGRWDRVDESAGVDSMISLIDVEIVDINEQAAAGGTG